MNVLILVSAGNSKPAENQPIEEAVTGYPNYLTEPGNRFFEPAGALNVVTVGSLAHGEGVTDRHQEEVGVRPIARLLQPSPFTRTGPGVKGAIKPDVVDFGGTLVFDPVVQQLQGGGQMHSAGIVTLYHRPIDRLFTAGSGTSYATPLVAHKASQILKIIPSASANLLRALLIGAAEIPFAAQDCLAALGEDATRSICGHGHIDTEKAAYSDDARVVLYAEDELPLDHFAVYAIPIPELYQQEAGRRHIRITLAFDPPVRHTRSDYTGVSMSYRLVRGCSPETIFEHYRKRNQDDGPFPEIAKKYACDLKPGPNSRDKSTVQTSSVTFSRDVSNYGDNYYLVVRCEGGWAKEQVESQRFAVVVELSHEAEIALYQRVRVRLTA